jgi:hypothetical protein
MGMFTSKEDASTPQQSERLAISDPTLIQSWRPAPSSHLLESFEASNLSWARFLETEVDDLDSPADSNIRMAAQKYYSAVISLLCKHFKCAPTDEQLRILELLQVASFCSTTQVWSPRGARSKACEHEANAAKQQLATLLREFIANQQSSL